MQLRALGTDGPQVSVLGLGLAALGRPAYMVLGHADDLRGSADMASMQARTSEVLDAAYALGIRYVDAARSYGLAELFLSRWLEARSPANVVVGSKWGYRYTADWRLDADVNEVKDHTLTALEQQWEESQALLSRWLGLYQIHSATLESGVLDDTAVLRKLFALRAGGTRIGLSASGPKQAEVIRRALAVTVDGVRLFDAVQATWNLLERNAGDALKEAHAAGVGVIVKEALANGKLSSRGGAPVREGHRPDAVALAAVLQTGWADVVLCGAVTVEQLNSNVGALAVPREVVGQAMADVVPLPAAEYWAVRSQLKWT